MWGLLWVAACSFDPDGGDEPLDTAAPLPEELPWDRLSGSPPAEALELPDFQAIDSTGEPRTWAHLYGTATALWFLGASDPEGCGLPCAWEAERARLAAVRVRVVGVSDQGAEALAVVVQSEALGFELWSDVDGTLASTYGAVGALGGSPAPKAVLLSDRGIWTVDYPAPASPSLVATDAEVVWGP